MTEPKEEKSKSPSESEIAITQAKKHAQGWMQVTVNSLIRFAPVGGSSFLFLSFLREQAWLQVLITFPITVIFAIWTAYSESVLTRFYAIYKERGAKDVDSLMAWIDKMDQVIKETIKWQLAGVEDKYLKCQGKFGFTVQRDIWLDCAGQIGEYELEPYLKFAEEVRWYNREKDQWFMNMEYQWNNTSVGHLPSPYYLPYDTYIYIGGYLKRGVKWGGINGSTRFGLVLIFFLSHRGL